MLKIEKRGVVEAYDAEKIKKVFKKINKELPETDMVSEQEMNMIIADFEKAYNTEGEVVVTLEQLEDFLEKALINKGKLSFGKLYILTRYQKNIENKITETDKSIMWLVEQENKEVGNENSNKDARIAPTQRDLIAGEVSKDIARRILIPQDIMQAHDDGVIHFHDLDYFIQKIHNCELINIKDALDNGTIMNGKMVESPKSFQVACTVMTQIIASVASSTYGGQTANIKHLGKYLFNTKQKYIKKLKEQLGAELSDEQIEKIVKLRVKEELSAGIQTIQYQLNTLLWTNWQSPFLTLFLELDPKDPYISETAEIIEEIFKQRIQGIKNEKGVYITNAFPKLVYVLDEHNCLKGGKYDYLTKLAVKCSAKRMYPDYISAKKMRENYEGNVFGPMWCRAFLSPWKDEEGNYKFEWRFNQGVVSLNLPQIAIIADGDEEKFWELLEERLSIAYKALLVRHERLKGTPATTAPILRQHGIIARLGQDDTIDPLLYNWYSTISLWYIGIYETTYLMKGVSHTNPKGEAFALKVLQTLRNHCDQWKKETGLGFALYWTPAESLCYRFARIDKKKFGNIKNVTDKGYYTNSYHVDVREEINAFEKLKFESQFQTISSGGAISYIEMPNMQNNLSALEEIVKFIYENIQYAEFNTKSDVCNVCWFEGEIVLNKNTEWECPQCHNTDQNKMNVVRRTCFTKDNLVLTKEWYKTINKVEIGDEVLTKENRYMPVADKIIHEGKDTVVIKSATIDEIICTPDHQFLVKSLEVWKWLSEPYYKEAQSLNENDFLIQPIENVVWVEPHLNEYKWTLIKTREEAYMIQQLMCNKTAKPYKVVKTDSWYYVEEYDYDWKTLIESKPFKKVLSRFISRIEGKKETVYSLTVVEDASYTVQNQFVKNCGYLGERYWNKGKTKEISKRVMHLGGETLLNE